MERLTKRNQYDTAYYYPYCIEASGCDGIGSSGKCDECDFDFRICSKLGEYEDLEEQGKLIKLPCAVGDTLYVIPTRENGLSKITKMKCLGFYIGEPNNVANLFPIDRNEASVKMYQPDFAEFEKTVFLTMEEAEAALAEMDKKEGTHAEEKEQPETE